MDITRRHLLSILAAPVITGYALKMSAAGNGTIADITPDITRVSDKVMARLKTLPVDLAMRDAETILVSELRDAGFVNENVGDRYTEKARGRYMVVRAQDPVNFMPKIGALVYPSRSGYDMGALIKIELV